MIYCISHIFLVGSQSVGAGASVITGQFVSWRITQPPSPKCALFGKPQPPAPNVHFWKLGFAVRCSTCDYHLLFPCLVAQRELGLGEGLDTGVGGGAGYSLCSQDARLLSLSTALSPVGLQAGFQPHSTPALASALETRGVSDAP